jgi:hypothetical protein
MLPDIRACIEVCPLFIFFYLYLKPLNEVSKRWFQIRDNPPRALYKQSSAEINGASHGCFQICQILTLLFSIK